MIRSPDSKFMSLGKHMVAPTQRLTSSTLVPSCCTRGWNPTPITSFHFNASCSLTLFSNKLAKPLSQDASPWCIHVHSKTVVEEAMQSTIEPLEFPLLNGNYKACTIPWRLPSDDPRVPTPTELSWINLMLNVNPSFNNSYHACRPFDSNGLFVSIGPQTNALLPCRHSPMKKRAESDTSVPDAVIKAEKFARRYAEILQDLKKDPASHGGPPDIILLCRLREQLLREVGFRDIFKKVKDEENARAISLFESVVRLNDAIEDEGKQLENLVRGIFAGNVFDLGSVQLAEAFSKDGMSFSAACEKLVPRPWIIDDLDTFKMAWSRKMWKKVIIFVDNSGADIILGILPFARELLRRGSQVVLAANDLPSINDVTYSELVEIVSKIRDEEARLMGVSTSNLLISNSGNDLPVIDLTRVSQEVAYLASDADLVVLEGMGRGIETNLNAQFKCDSLKIGMVKHLEVAEFLGSRMYDCVIKFNEV